MSKGEITKKMANARSAVKKAPARKRKPTKKEAQKLFNKTPASIQLGKSGATEGIIKKIAETLNINIKKVL